MIIKGRYLILHVFVYYLFLIRALHIHTMNLLGRKDLYLGVKRPGTVTPAIQKH